VKVAFGSDHAGLELKRELMPFVESLGHKVVDLGNAEFDAADDYPDFARPVGVAVARGEADRGIMVCGSGVGASIAVNKVPGARGAVCHDTFSARQGEVVAAFLGARFSNAARHARRLEKVKQIELDARTGVFEFPEVKK
jgi:ribose 5-phosphate isomerase B